MPEKQYDETNIFARILRGEIPCDKLDECEHTLCFRDINPQAPVHLLVIPKGAFVDWDDFADRASAAEQAALVRAVGRAARLAGVDATGWRLLSNIGAHGHQEVPHLHVHILGGEPIGPLRAH